MWKHIATLKSQSGGQSRSLKVLNTIRYIGYGFLLAFYSNLVPKMHHFWDIRLQKCRDLENRVRGPSPFDTARMSVERLLTFHSNHGPISYRFWDRRRFQSKNRTIFPPLVFCVPAEWVPLGIGHRRWGSKTRMMEPPGWQRSLTISSAVWIQCTNVTDGRTDGQIPGDSKERAYA